ncbi:MAG: hypothetical protein A2087_03310 [Spirochaetes bacterium GWD1_61_31]|nr:MAG: hypothetical protein A2Y37_05890 [Spirochaetes bacterium GWB1_60_80]OHD33792.1 MAG: hypothetical protein A2004_08835 [Spirochaetes bacterium GWC1_61_12]OHD35474.1 MAG: hypothetical protein A2087_03310 [Spirochaetes bacterium GWD1_61_31]OHD41539.1 MAG: hypothetical protein A2Y35_09670 [Spirochaetes bacterium GWE1_60_18]OHD61439.1 MAG: hypothetical protein A2Y32_09745 [Spirochaetes bacterium GWF1_60_12]HAP44787.1 hypothetical protein [Spirochaetaceae bacterium]
MKKPISPRHCPAWSLAGLVLVVLIVSAGLAACSATQAELSGQPAAWSPPAEGQPQTGLPLVTLRCGDVELRVEVARTDQQKNIGLMFRRELADGRGMIFVYAADQRMSYWMENTYLPLSIAFLAADGTVREIYDMTPLSRQSVPSSRSVRYALEVPQGWYGRVGIGPGDRFVFPAGFPD